jgi:hypothetical protein
MSELSIKNGTVFPGIMYDCELGSLILRKQVIYIGKRIDKRFWHPPNLLSVGTGDYFHGVKQPGREIDHSRPTNGEIKAVEL